MLTVDAALIEANDDFYDAVAQGDLLAMDRLWAKTFDITCIHPGSEVLVGRGDVLASWRAIFESGPPAITCSAARVHRLDHFAVVACEEHIGEVNLVASNVFAMERGVWRLVHHHGSMVERRLGDVSARHLPKHRLN